LKVSNAGRRAPWWARAPHLFAVGQRLERRAHGDLGLAVADVAAQQAIHRLQALHVPLDVLAGGDLVLGGREFEGVLELALPVAVLRKGEAFGQAAFGVEFEQLVRHVAHLGLDARFRAAPGGAAQAIELRLGVARSPKLLDLVHARERYVQLRFAGVLHQHEVALLVALQDFAEAQKLADAVGDVDHEIAGFEIGDVGGEGGHLRLGERRTRHQIGTVEEVVAADEDQSRVGQHHAFANGALDQVGAGHAARQVRAFGERGTAIGARVETQLVRDLVLLQDVRQPLEFADGGREEGDPVAFSTRVLASATATCMLPWKAVEGREGMCSDSCVTAPISSSRRWSSVRSPN